MLEFSMFAYGLLTSMVLGSATRNARLRRPNPALLHYLGYVLCGASMATSALLFGYAGWLGLHR